jgi:hypothetical protein
LVIEAYAGESKETSMHWHSEVSFW